MLLPGFAGAVLPEWLASRLRGGLAGVCLFGGNVESRPQLRRLTAAILEANPNAVIAVDEEGGDVTRLFHDVGSPYPGNAILGRIDDEAYTERIAASVGWELRAVGCTMTLAPDVDINSNPDNPVIGVRSFGADPGVVARHGEAWIRGMHSTGIEVSPKHFPGHGDTAQDSHLSLPEVDLSLEVLRERELVPFRSVIEAGARTIMTSHILVPGLDPDAPATLSGRILRGLLREELGFTGVIVSDALDMAGASGSIGIPEAAVRALAAGCDLLCLGADNTDAQLDEIEQAIGSAMDAGRLARSRVADASERVRRLATAAASRREAAAPAGVTEAPFDLGRTAAAFDLRPGIRVRPRRHLVALDNAANIAVGAAPWMPCADRRLSTGGALGDVPKGSQLVLLGRDNHRHAWVRDLVDAARVRHPDAIVVDLGWPADDRAYADVATFGASAHVGEALMEWLAAAGSENDGTAG